MINPKDVELLGTEQENELDEGFVKEFTGNKGEDEEDGIHK